MAKKQGPTYYVKIVNGRIQKYSGFGDLEKKRAISQQEAQAQAESATSSSKEYGLIEILQGNKRTVKIFTSGKFCINQVNGTMGPCGMKAGKMV